MLAGVLGCLGASLRYVALAPTPLQGTELLAVSPLPSGRAVTGTLLLPLPPGVLLCGTWPMGHDQSQGPISGATTCEPWAQVSLGLTLGF